MRETSLFIVCLFSSFFTTAQDFQWLQPQEFDKISIAENGDIYIIDIFYYSKDIDPGPNEWILTGVGFHNYIAKFDSEWNFQWGYALQSLTVTDINSDNQHVIITGFTTSQASIDSKTNQYNLADNLSFAARFASNGQCDKIIRVSKDNASIESGTIKNDTMFIVGRIFQSVDFDMDPFDTYMKSPNGFESGYMASYSKHTYPDWAYVFEDDGPGSVEPRKIVQRYDELLMWGFYEGTVDFDPLGGISQGLDTIPTWPIFVARLTLDGNLLWAKSFIAEYSFDPSDLESDNSHGSYLTGIFQGRLLLGTDKVLLEGSSENSGTFLIRFDEFGNIDWQLGIHGDLRCHKPSLMLAPEGQSLWWVGSVNGNIDLDPGPDVFTIQTNPNPNQGAYFNFWKGSYITEIELNGNVEKVNYFNTETEVFFDKMIAQPNQDFYILYGGSSNRNFDHDFGLAEYYDTTLTRSYIAKYDGVRIPEALGFEAVAPSEIKVYPNPSSNKFRIENASDLRIIGLTDLSGRQVPFSYDGQLLTIDTTIPGIYVLQIASEKSIQTFKLIASPK